MKKHEIYMIGVGGQGIGMLSEILIRSADHAGLESTGVDTHGLAQRGGSVESFLRIGRVHSPLVRKNRANLVLALERNEAFRAAEGYLAENATLVYYDAVWQPLDVRLSRKDQDLTKKIKSIAEKQKSEIIRVYDDSLPDPRMQNIALLAKTIGNNLLDPINADHVEMAMADLMDGKKLEGNIALFRKLLEN